MKQCSAHMFTVEQVCTAMSIAQGTSRTQIKKQCHLERVHCRELVAAIEDGRAARANTWPDGKFRRITPRQAKLLGVHWVLWTGRPSPRRTRR